MGFVILSGGGRGKPKVHLPPFSRVLGSDCALKSIALSTTVVPTLAVQSTLTRSIVSHSTLVEMLSSRTISTSASTYYNTRTVLLSTPLKSTLIRTITPIYAALLSTNNRNVVSTLSLQRTLTRSMSSTTSALQSTIYRNVTSRSVLQGTLTRTVTPVTVSFGNTLSRTLSTSSAVKSTLTRTTVISSTLKSTLARTIANTSTLKSTLNRTVSLTTTLDTANTIIVSIAAYWALSEFSDGSSAVTRLDSSGNGNSLTDATSGAYKLASIEDGYIGRGVDFLRADHQRLTINDNASIALSTDTPFTWSLWFQTFDVSDDSGEGYILIKGDYTPANSYEYYIHVASGMGTVDFAVSNGTTSATVSATLTSEYRHFLICWHDPVANTINIQLDNAAPISTAWSSGTQHKTTPLNIGTETAAGLTFNGNIDEVGFWKRVLTNTERTYLWNNGYGRTWPIQNGDQRPVTYTPSYTRTPAALPGSLGANEKLVTVNAAGGGNGSLASPWTFTEGIANIASGQTLLFGDGLYTVPNSLTLGKNTASRITYKRATPTSRVMFRATTTTQAPQVQLTNLTTMDGIWIGCDTRDEVDHTITHGNDCIIQNCTLFNMMQGINEGGAIRSQYLNNRFVYIGQGTYFHAIYINNAAALAGQGATLNSNIFIGYPTGGYQLHLYHDPSYVTMYNNFIAGGLYCTAINGPNAVAQRNIYWQTYGFTGVYIEAATNLVYNKNLHGRKLHQGLWGSPPMTSSGNISMRGQMLYGTSPVTWVDSNVQTNLGVSVKDINDAWEGAQYAFSTLTMSQLYQDANIETPFTTINTALTAMRGLP
jgi:hypothetical protein